MAARSGAGTGVVVGLVVFVLSTIFLLILTIVFYSKYQKATDESAMAKSSLNEYATATQRGSDRYTNVVTAAKGQGRSAVEFLMDERQQIMTKVVGNATADLNDLSSRLSTYTEGDASGVTYTDVLSRLQGDLRAARNENADLAEQLRQQGELLTQRDTALQQAEEDRDRQVQAVRDMIATFTEDVQRYGTDVDETKRRMMTALRDLETSFNSQVDQLERDRDQLRTEIAMKDQQLQMVQDILNEIRRQAQNPALLVDARVLANANAEGQIFIDKGRADRVTLGMTFEIYDAPEQLRVDEVGNLPRGKASCQIINVGETSSTCKITRESRGQPVVRGDVLANAVYDPDKEYLFLVHGKFDLNGDGVPSEPEAERIRSLVSTWGGKIAATDQVRGDLDFLVLGVQPTKPLALPENPTQVQVEIWVAQNQAFQMYNELFQQAMQANIPVLNQNRFLILIGHTYN